MYKVVCTQKLRLITLFLSLYNLLFKIFFFKKKERQMTTIKRGHRRCSGIFIVNFEHISPLILVFL